MSFNAQRAKQLDELVRFATFSCAGYLVIFAAALTTFGIVFVDSIASTLGLASIWRVNQGFALDYDVPIPISLHSSVLAPIDSDIESLGGT